MRSPKRPSSISGQHVLSVHDVATAKRFNSKVAATLGAYSDADIFASATNPGRRDHG